MKRSLFLLFIMFNNFTYCQSDTIDFGNIGKYTINELSDATFEVAAYDSLWVISSKGKYKIVDSVKCKNCSAQDGSVDYITDTGILFFEGKCAIPVGEWKDYDATGRLEKITIYTNTFYSYGIISCNYKHGEISNSPISKPCPGSIIYEAFPSQISYFKNDMIVRIEYYVEGLLEGVITYSE